MYTIEDFTTKYFLCYTTNNIDENNRKSKIKYHCIITKNIDEANKIKIEKECLQNEHSYFITKTFGPMISRQIQVEKEYEKIINNIEK